MLDLNALRMMERAASAVPTPGSGEVALFSIDGSALLLKDDLGVVRGSHPSQVSFSATATWRIPRGQVNATAASVVSQTMYLWPICLPRPLLLDGLATFVTTAGTGGTPTIQLCVYSDNESFLPSTLLKATAAMAASTTGMKTETFTDVALPAGPLWIGYIGIGTTSPPLCPRASGPSQSTGSGIPEWMTMSLGTGAAPAGGPGNDPTVVTQASQATAPSTATVTVSTDSNAPKYPIYIAMRLRRA